MFELHLFGASSPTGKSLAQKIKKNKLLKLIGYSRSNPSYKFIDLSKKNNVISNSNSPFIIVSLAPIWLFADFFAFISKENKTFLKNLKGLIICSSSSVITKRFANNEFDKKLVSLLLLSENKIVNEAKKNKIPIRLIRPTLIYGDYLNYEDKNISNILKAMTILPLIPLPSKSGLRQPIHTSQLSEYIIKISQFLLKGSNENKAKEIINLGGDEEISYFEMLIAIKKSLPKKHKAKKCIILEIPSKFFYFIFSPLLIFNNKFFGAILRIGSNLSGFEKVYKLSKTKPKKFPIS
ncbi:hypothetical protein [Prochlorococcus marinus]|uniref:Nucleoside-diphosphate-sugar epimerase n=1 Tax=Prochlorococcus marinus (strain AS9601) TaxID=146891 RepID=A2BSC5_PROMS|nr:hypothetical protein [Prochlorococcus marinus]ABM70686.1 Hypothetical protein A9601_14021 [Prochlorococcus marinus str. AS9601]